MRIARLTPPGAAGIALLRCEGPGTSAWLERSFRRAHGSGLPAPGRVAVGSLLDEQGQLLDEVLVARAGPERLELSCHGGPAVVAQVWRALLRAGGLPADRDPRLPDQGRVAWEAERALPGARSELACQVLLQQRAGALARAVAELSSQGIAGGAGLARLLGTASLGRALLTPPRVALVGPPNAGKSSLMNALLGRERVIVSSEAGTTRDAVRETCELGGLAVALEDTAGQRETPDALEAAGVARARRRAARADLRLVVLDATDLRSEALELVHGAPRPRLLVLNKRDLLDPAEKAALAARFPEDDPLLISALRGDGLEELATRLRRACVGEPHPTGAVVFTPRQAGLIAGALRALERGRPERARACLEAIDGLA